MPGVTAAPEQLRRPRSARRRASRTPRGVAVRALLVSALAGPVVGLAWWLAAPGGFRDIGDSSLTQLQSAGSTDAAFALACLISGAVAGLWWVLVRAQVLYTGSIARLVGLLVGGVLGGVLAWLSGAGLELLSLDATPDLPEASRVGDGYRPNLAVVAGVLLWPLAVGVMVLVDTVRDLVWQALNRDEDSRSGSAALS